MRVPMLTDPRGANTSPSPAHAIVVGAAGAVDPALFPDRAPRSSVCAERDAYPRAIRTRGMPTRRCHRADRAAGPPGVRRTHRRRLARTAPVLGPCDRPATV